MDDSITNDANPYSAPKSPPSGKRTGEGQVVDAAMTEGAALLRGAIWSVVSAFPIAGLMGLLFRFPVPFVGYVSGFEAIIPAMLAVIFYGVFMGGLVLIGVLGAIGGAVTANLTSPVL